MNTVGRPLRGLLTPLRRGLTTNPAQGNLTEFLRQVARGQISADAAAAQIETLGSSFDSLKSFAKIDYSRQARTGFPEVIYGESKTALQVADILENMCQRASEGGPRVILASRISAQKHADVVAILQKRASGQAALDRLVYNEAARLQSLQITNAEPEVMLGRLAVMCAGTADLPVAEEAAAIAELSNVKVERLYDVGIAGIHRLFNKLHIARDADVAICVAGMDGALPTVVAGLVECPVIAVPTSVGYGVSTGGRAALGTMLSACAPGLAVVNIDNGLGAAAMAIKILRGYHRKRQN